MDKARQTGETAMLRWVFGATLAVLAGPLHAQSVPEDAMEVQRCVWRCLDASGGAESAEYHACVASTCDGAAGVPASGGVVAVWTVVEVAGGQAMAAYAVDDTMGTELWVVCTLDGASRRIEMLGAEGPDAMLTLNIDGTSVFPLSFTSAGDVARADLAPPFAELSALKAGSAVGLMNADGYAVFSSTLKGSSAAIVRACADQASE